MRVFLALFEPAASGQVSLAPVHAAEVPSASEPGASHLVRLLADGSWACTCPGFAYGARTDGMCRHIDQVMAHQAACQTLAFLLGTGT